MNGIRIKIFPKWITPLMFGWAFLMVLQMNGQYSQNDWEERDTWMNLDTLWTLLNIQEGDRVGDLGANRGYLSVRLAQKVGRTGKVYAADIRSDYLKALETLSREKGFTQIETLLSESDDPKFPSNSLDLVFVIDTYHEIEAQQKVLRHIKNALVPGGKVVFVEKVRGRERNKTRAEQTGAHSLAARFVIKDLQEQGFIIEHYIEKMGNWKGIESDIFWGIIGKRPL